MRRSFVALAALVAACGRKSGPPAFPPPEVSVIEVRPGTVAQSYEFTGEVVSYRRVEVRARVDGVIEERAFTEGMFVKPGQVLYRIAEISGSDSVVHFDLDGQKWVSQSHGIHRFGVGEAAAFRLEVTRGLYFDAGGRCIAAGE